MAGTKKPKGRQAREQQTKQKTAKNNRGDIEKEESKLRFKEGGKKGLEEYENGVTEETHSQGSASSPQKTRGTSCEVRPPLEEGDFKAKGKEPGKETNQFKAKGKEPEKETDHLKAKGKEPEKEPNHFKGKHMALVEKDPVSSLIQQSTPSLQKKMVYSSEGQSPKADKDDGAKLEEEKANLEKEKAKLEKKKAELEKKKARRSACSENARWEWHSELDTELLTKKFEVPARLTDDEDDGAKCKEENAILKKEIAIFMEKIAISEKEIAELTKRVKCLGDQILLRQAFVESREQPSITQINETLWIWVRLQNRSVFGNMQQKKFSTAVAALVKEMDNVEDAENKLKLLQKAAESWKPAGTVFPGLVWDEETGKGFFTCCKVVALLNEKLHPNIEGDEAKHRIEEMASNKKFIYDDVDMGQFMMKLLQGFRGPTKTLDK